MTALKQQTREPKAEELSEAELKQASGGIIAVLRQATQMCDGSVAPSPVTAQSQNALIGLL